MAPSLSSVRVTLMSGTVPELVTTYVKVMVSPMRAAMGAAVLSTLMAGSTSEKETVASSLSVAGVWSSSTATAAKTFVWAGSA